LREILERNRKVDNVVVLKENDILGTDLKDKEDHLLIELPQLGKSVSQEILEENQRLRNELLDLKDQNELLLFELQQLHRRENPEVDDWEERENAPKPKRTEPLSYFFCAQTSGGSISNPSGANLVTVDSSGKTSLTKNSST
jgi:hypothetical protein